MSLLLDALKKAAEKKARQAEGGNDESEVIDGKDELTENYGFQEDNTLVSKNKTEQTERYEHSTLLLGDRTEHDDDQTDLSRHDDTEIYEDEYNFGEDDTQISDEATIFQAVSDLGDDTELTEIADKTEFTEYIEDTELFNETEFTEISDGTELTELIDDNGFNEDETVTAAQLSNRDVLDFLGGSEPPRSSSDITVEAAGASIDADAVEVSEDLSLYLIDGEDAPTDKADDTTVSGAHINNQADNTDAEGLQLADYRRPRDEQTSTITADQNPTVTAAAGIELDSLRHEHTIIRPDATSTHTYAPDNYDRTLIRPPDNDASRIFAGMKSEEDVLMTPDYAKRVFLSKSSAIRSQHNKVYLGIAISILLVIGIFSLFQLQEESDRIDSALMPLKRDPKPGILTIASVEEKSSLFENNIDTNVDLKTLKIVESAELTAPTGESGEQAVSEAEPTEPTTKGEQIEQGRPEESQAATEAAESSGSVDESLENNASIVVKSTATESKPEEQVSGNLQITSNSQVTEKDRWLAEAYSAYQKGDDKTALEKYLKVLEIDPVNRNALLARAAISVQNGETTSAIEDYQQLLIDNPKDSLAMSSLISVANTLPAESESQLKLMIRDEPDSPYLNFVLANIYAAQNRWQEAQSLYFKALENNPKDPNYAYNLAVSLEHIAKPEVAITYYERAISNIKNGIATFNKAAIDNRIEMLRQL